MDCNVAFTKSSFVVARVNPKIVPRASGFQYGAPKPVNAGTR